MGDRLVATVPAKTALGRSEYHLAKGPGDGDWQPIWCGGGVALPGPRAHVLTGDVCSKCWAARAQARR